VLMCGQMGRHEAHGGLIVCKADSNAALQGTRKGSATERQSRQARGV
jgi:hypothetical protein